MQTTDFLIIGAGAVGLTIAREIKLRYPDQRILVLEKELQPGLHSSGRNSGVLHSGIYYPPDSLKARVCRQGAIEMAEFHERYSIPLDKRGKILVGTSQTDAPQLELLAQRARLNDIHVEKLDAQQLRTMEPEARSATGEALWVPITSVGTPAAMMKVLREELEDKKIVIQCGARLKSVNLGAKSVTLDDGSVVGFGHVINAAGLHADRVAHQFETGLQYTLLPFKGIYWKLDPNAGFNLRHLIYPVPDLRVPFLGVHTTTTTDGTTYLGPTAVPAFGRENYYGFQGVSVSELARIAGLLLKQYVNGQDGFRRLTWQEGSRYFKQRFAQAAKSILPRLRPEHLLPTEKVGIRAQMLNTQTGRLVTDFLVEQGQFSTHILNAISPAWTSAFPFARYVCDHFLERKKLII